MKTKGNLSFALLLSVALMCAWSLPVVAQTIVSFNMDSDPGWTTEGQWAYGQPQGVGGDPSSGYTGDNVYGYNLAGKYPNNIPRHYLTTTAIDCSNHEDVVLTFRRWLGVESRTFDRAGIEVSNDGSTWTSIWEHNGNSFTDSFWVELSYDISAVADGQETVYIRWRMGTTDGSVTYCGWNIDDVVLTGDLMDALSVTSKSEQVFSGYERGPFSPTNLTFDVQNTGTNTISWTVSCPGPFLLSTTGGVLTAGSTRTVEVALDTGVDSWDPGGYFADVVFRNETSAYEKTVTVGLQIDARVLDYFDWEPVGTTQFVGLPFPVMVTAKDATGLVFTNFSDTALLTGLVVDTQENQSILGGPSHMGTASIDGGFTFGYSFTPAVPITVTDVRHYFGNKVSIWSDAGELLVSQNVVSSSGSWVETPLSTPLILQAGVRYRVGIYFEDQTFYLGFDLPNSFADGSIDQSYQGLGDSFPVYSDGYQWWFVDLGYSVNTEVPVSIIPANTASFVDGVWTGAVTVLEAANNMFLRASDSGGPSGDSNPLTVLPLLLSVVLPDQTSEGDPDFSVQVLANYPSETDMLIALANDNTNAIVVPENVVIPAGQTRVIFSAQVVDDTLLDGTASVTITASTTNYLSGADSMYVHDNETAMLTVSLPSTTSEGAGAIPGALIVSAPVDADVPVELVSNNPSEVGHGSLIIPAGQSYVSFSLPVLDDAEIDGVQTATIEAHVENWQSGYASVFVLDNEPTGIDLQLPASLTEGDGVVTNGGLVAIPATAIADINLLLSCSDPTELVVPAYVTIPAGTNQVAFDVSVVDDMETDGAITASVFAQAPGYIPDSSSIVIADNDPHHLLVEGLSGDINIYDSVSVAVSARTLDGGFVDVFSEMAALTADGDRGAVSIIPGVLSNIVDGVVFGTVRFGNIGNDVLLIASGGGMTGTSTVFNVTGSQIAISPAGLTNTLVVADAVATRTMVVSNAGNADLEFEIQTRPAFSNLVINGDFEQGNSGFTSAYAYTPGTDSPAKGIYTVADDSKTWNGGFTTTMKDHTSGGGQMLMANGNSTGTAVVWQQEVPVVAGFTYNVSAWTTSLFGEFLPSLNFQVNGASIGSVVAENLAWTEFSTLWTATSSGTAIFSIVDAQFIPPFLPGNHFAIDDIVFQPFESTESGLMAHYPFNGNASDESGNGLHGTVSDATLTTNRFGAADSAYHFNGSTSYINLGSLGGFKTVSMWIKQETRSGFDFYFGHNQFRVYASTGATGELKFEDGAGSIMSSVEMNDQIGQWVHVTAISDGANSKIYFNGTNVTVTGMTLDSVSANPVNLGRWTGDMHYLNGDLDDVRIYDRALLESEIQALFNGIDPIETIKSEPGLVASYPFNGDAGDDSGNEYDGTPVGATLMTNRFGEIDSAYYFDGVDDRIDLPGEPLNFERTNSYSQSFWIKSADMGGSIISKTAGGSAFFKGTGISVSSSHLRVSLIDHLFFGKIQVEGSTFVNDNQWHHVVVSYDGSSMASGVKVYVDGSLESMTVISDTLAGTILNNAIPSVGANYNGAIDDIRIYNHVLSEAEVAVLYTGNEGGSNPLDIPWLSANPDSGIIPPGTNMVTTVRFDAAGLMAGDHTNAMLIITCNDVLSPTNEVPASMYMIPPAPVMDAEPETTYGSSNAVSWSMVDGPVTYLVEVATDTVSTARQQSDWLEVTNHTFHALATNQIYYYRARASVESHIGRLEGPWSGWVWSTQLPERVDGDQDGIPDWWEELHFGGTGIAGASTDFDGDGQSDHNEFVAGMNPTNPASYFMINDASVPTNGPFVLYWDAVTDRVYSVHWTPALTNAFQPMATNIYYPQGSYTDEVHQTEEGGFYRIDVELQ